MALTVKISQKLTDDHFAAVGEFVYKPSEKEERTGMASVIVKKEGLGLYSLVIDDKLYPSDLDGNKPAEYIHAKPVKMVGGKLIFRNFHIKFKQ